MTVVDIGFLVSDNWELCYGEILHVLFICLCCIILIIASCCCRLRKPI